MYILLVVDTKEYNTYQIMYAIGVFPDEESAIRYKKDNPGKTYIIRSIISIK